MLATEKDYLRLDPTNTEHLFGTVCYAVIYLC